MKRINLSVLDQSIIRDGADARQALKETEETIKLAEKLGFRRFWISEHHNSSFIAGSAPEVLIVKLAEITQHIRVGSGGIMLPNHSALKVAENFRLLENLYPGRIDLGMGRAPGGDRITAHLLNPSNDFSEESYLRQLSHLQRFFNDTAATDHGPIIATPQSPTIPAQWILSSSGGSSSIAAQFGMGLAVARFINGNAQPEMVHSYRKNFIPTEQFPSPKEILAISVLCGETEAIAMEMRKYIDYILIQFEKGNYQHFPDYASIQNYSFTISDQQRISANSGRIISGTPDRVKEALTQLANDFDVDEIMVSTMSGKKEFRLRSFELLASAFGTAGE